MFLGCALATIACQAARHRARPDDPPQPPPSASASPAPRPPVAASLDASAPKGLEALDLQTRRAMKIGAFEVSAPFLALTKRRFGRASADAILVSDVGHFAPVLRVPLGHPRSIVSLADGSLLGIGGAESVRLFPNQTKPRSERRVLLPAAPRVFADRQRPSRAWAIGRGGTTLFGYDFDGRAGRAVRGLAPDAWIALEGFDRRALGSLRDGSFVYTTKTGFRHAFTTGKTGRLRGDSIGVLRILPAARPDSMWALTSTRADLSIIVDGSVTRRKSVSFEAVPAQADTAGKFLVVLELLQPSDARWSYVLEAFDTTGKRRLRDTLAAAETTGPEWTRDLTRNRGLVVGSAPPIAVVGGPGAYTVWDLSTGKRVHHEP